MRPRLRVLRDSADARQAPLVRARRDRPRSTVARGAGRSRDQSRRAGPRALRPRSARQEARPARRARRARRETSIPWIRMLYVYSAGLTPRLLELMATESRIVPYLDMPIQHGVRRRVGAHASSGAPAHDSRASRGASARRFPTSPFARPASSDFPARPRRLRDAARVSRGDPVRSRRSVHVLRRRKERAPRRWRTTCPTSLKRERLERLNEIAAADHRRAIRSSDSAAPFARSWIVSTTTACRRATVWQADDIDGVTTCSPERAGRARARSSTCELDDVVDDVDFAASLVSVRVGAAGPRAAGASAPVLGSIGSYGR